METTPAGTLPGQRNSSGTRNPPSQLEFFSLRKGVMPPSGHVFMCGPLSVLYYLALCPPVVSSCRTNFFPASNLTAVKRYLFVVLSETLSFFVGGELALGSS